MEKEYDIQKIMEILPHRYPFLLVDRVLELVPGDRVSAIKNVTINEPFFHGHFPDKPIMPGVLIIEGMGQAGGILAFESFPEMPWGTVIYFMGMDKVRFRKPVVPGDQIRFELQILRIKMKVLKMSGKAIVDGNIAAQAEMMATFGDPE